MQAVRKAFKVAADLICWSISVPLPKGIVHLTEDLFTSILQFDYVRSFRQSWRNKHCL